MFTYVCYRTESEPDLRETLCSCTYKVLRDPRLLHSQQCIINPTMVARVVWRRSPEPENNRNVMIGSQLQQLLQAAHTLIGNQVLLVGSEGVHCPKWVILQLHTCINLYI